MRPDHRAVGRCQVEEMTLRSRRGQDQNGRQGSRKASRRPALPSTGRSRRT